MNSNVCLPTFRENPPLPFSVHKRRKYSLYVYKVKHLEGSKRSKLLTERACRQERAGISVRQE
jgi:hypothetical protein